MIDVDLEEMSLDELVALNRMVVEQIKLLQRIHTATYFGDKMKQSFRVRSVKWGWASSVPSDYGICKYC